MNQIKEELVNITKENLFVGAILQDNIGCKHQLTGETNRMSDHLIIYSLLNLASNITSELSIFDLFKYFKVVKTSVEKKDAINNPGFYNLNKKVKVKLTDTGINIYKDYWREINPQKEPNLDSDGYLEDQLWFIIAIFGKGIHLGAPELPFHPNIKLMENQ